MNIPKTCTHTKLDGETCRALALTGKRHCHYHDRYSDRNSVPKAKNTYALVPFEDTRSILFTINQLIYSFLNDLIDESKFTKTIYALQVAAQYVNRNDALSPDAEIELAEQEKAAEEQAEKEVSAKQSAKGQPSNAEVMKSQEDAKQLIEMLIGTITDLREQEEARHAEEDARKARAPLPFQKT